MIKALIFDLDNCLAPSREMELTLYHPAFEAIRRANDGLLSEQSLEAAFHDCWSHALDWVARRHGFSEEMLQAGWSVMERLEVKTNVEGYGDLSILSQLNPLQFLVTSGFERLQKSKINALRIAHQFTAIHIDAIDAPARKGKRKLFEQIMNRHQFEPEAVLVIGDNEHSEILAAGELGIRTVQTLRPDVAKSEKATYHVSGLEELKMLLETELANS